MNCKFSKDIVVLTVEIYAPVNLLIQTKASEKVDKQAIVEMRGISKSFPGVQALSGVNLTLYPGCVHGLVGENGAGKSTLMKILTGTYQADEGEMIVLGQKSNFKTEREALDAGLAIVPQELSYVPGLTIEENLFLGREPASRGFLKKQERSQMAKELMERLEISLDTKTKMESLTVAQCQLVEIVKAISRDAKVIIMDEPTSSLTDVEVKHLFKQVRALREQGISIVYISHKLEEIIELCDDVTVLRDSQYIGYLSKDEISQDRMIEMMVGRKIGKLYPEIGKKTDKEMLRVENFSEPGVFSNISFTVNAGEVVGFSGMVGAGRSEVLRAVFGLDHHSEGKVFVEGKEVPIHSTQDAIAAGMGMVLEDRQISGIIPGLSVKDNIVMANAIPLSNHGFLNKKLINDQVKSITSQLAVKIPSINEIISNLSGGNQQKVILCKWLLHKVKILILDEPTRGIDVGAKEEIYQLIKELAEQGMAIIFISSEMPELIGNSQRIIVMDGGMIKGEFSHDEVTQEKIMETIVGGGNK